MEAIRGSGFDFVSEVKDSAGLTVANTVENTWSGCTLCFFEPYYLLTYKDVTEEESKNFPDRYYIKREKQEIRLPAIVRPGFHFKEWSGGLYFADKKRDGSDTVYTFDWENNIEKATYNWVMRNCIRFLRKVIPSHSMEMAGLSMVKNRSLMNWIRKVIISLISGNMYRRGRDIHSWLVL